MRGPFLLLFLGVSIPLATAGALGLSQTSPQETGTAPPVAEAPAAAALEAEAPDADAPIVASSAEPGQPRRAMECRNRCVLVDGMPRSQRQCRPYVAPGLANPEPFPADPPGPQPTCLPMVRASLVSPTSNICWIGANYCRHTQRGRTGYPCRCQGRSGRFG